MAMHVGIRNVRDSGRKELGLSLGSFGLVMGPVVGLHEGEGNEACEGEQTARQAWLDAIATWHGQKHGA